MRIMTERKPVSFEIGSRLSEKVMDGIFTVGEIWDILSKAESHLKLSPILLVVPKGKGVCTIYNRVGGEMGILKKTLREPLWIKQVDYGTHRVRYAYAVADWELKQIDEA